MLHLRLFSVRVSFAVELDRELAERWNYRWTKGYGSKEFSVANPDKVGHDKVTVTSAKLEKDGKTVFVTIDDMKPVMQMSINFDLESKSGNEVRGTIYNTVHVLGKD